MGTILADEPRELILEPGRAEKHYWRDIWAYRELFAILAWRDVSVRYKQTAIGIAWAVVRPSSPWWSSRSCSAELPNCPARALHPIRSWFSPACCPGFCFLRPERGIEQSGPKCQSDRQGLLPAHHHPWPQEA